MQTLNELQIELNSQYTFVFLGYSKPYFKDRLNSVSLLSLIKKSFQIIQSNDASINCSFGLVLLGYKQTINKYVVEGYTSDRWLMHVDYFQLNEPNNENP